jgi:myosin-15
LTNFALFSMMDSYVTEHGNGGFRTLCQQKLLLAKQDSGPSAARSFPPTLLEWQANIKQTNMALSAMLSDGDYSDGLEFRYTSQA